MVDEAREICAISRSTVQAAIEVLAGTRPAQQLSRRLDPRCLAALQHRAALTRRVASGSSPTAGRLHRNPSVRSVRACRVSDDVYEASAVVVEESRVRAVALRLEREHGGLARHRAGDRLNGGRRQKPAEAADRQNRPNQARPVRERRHKHGRTGAIVPVLLSQLLLRRA